MHRRDFVKTTLKATLAAPLMPTFMDSLMKKNQIALQLWSIREDMKKDPLGTLRAVRDMGYRYVEGGVSYANGKFYDLAPGAFKKELQTLGLQMPTGHGGLSLAADEKQLSDDFKLAVESAAAIGQKTLIWAWLPPEERPEGMRIAALLNKAGEYTRTMGIQLGYHNHDFELKKYQTPFLLWEELLLHTDPKLVTFQMDTYWVHYAGHDPAAWLQRYPNRFTSLHLKDQAATEQRETAEIGTGVINFKPILDVALAQGIRHYVVELEHYRTTPMQGVALSLKNLKQAKWL